MCHGSDCVEGTGPPTLIATSVLFSLEETSSTPGLLHLPPGLKISEQKIFFGQGPKILHVVTTSVIVFALLDWVHNVTIIHPVQRREAQPRSRTSTTEYLMGDGGAVAHFFLAGFLRQSREHLYSKPSTSVRIYGAVRTRTIVPYSTVVSNNL